MQGGKKVTKAKLGMESSFYFDEATKTWVDRSGASGTGGDSASGTASQAPPMAPPMAPIPTTTGPPGNTFGGPETTGGVGVGSQSGSPRVGGGPPRQRYVDVFARDGGTTSGPAVSAPVSAFVPSAAPIGAGFGGAPAPGMSFFVPAPAPAEEREVDAHEAPLELLRPTASATEEDMKSENVAPIIPAVDALEQPARTSEPAVEAESSAPAETPYPESEALDAFGGGASDWASEQTGAGVASDWAIDQADGGANDWVTEQATDQDQGVRWDAPESAHAESAGALWESQTQDWLQHEAAAAPYPVEEEVGAPEVVETQHISAPEPSSEEAHADAAGEAQASWEGYEGHEDYDYDPRWKWDENKNEWYWDGGDDDENWIERATHDAEVQELRSTIEATTTELEDIKLNRDAVADELAQALRRETELCAKVETLEVELASRAPEAASAEAVNEAFERGKEQGYQEGYAAGSAEAQEELADLLVCLGQEGRRVEKLRDMLAETGADMDAILAEFEAEEDEQIANLVAGEHDGAKVDTNDVSLDQIDDVDLSGLPEISPTMKAMAAEIDTPERFRDFRVSSNLSADADEFILPTPPKAKNRGERNLQEAFELA